MSELTGQILGDYRIEALLGEGGIGQVFRARQLRLDRSVAIKLIQERLARDPEFGARFLPAGRAAAALRHPNVVEIYDLGEQDGRLFLTMELFDDGSARALVRRQPRAGMPLALALDLARQAADGLAYVHRQGLVHGDVKPENLLLTRLGGVDERYALKLGDVGLLQAAESSDTSAAAYGTPAYLSPEQCLNQPLDGRSDIYSLGIVLYELCTGYVPFAVKTLDEARTKHVHAQPTPPRVVRPDLPAALEALILRCLAKQPADRFASAADLVEALQDLLRLGATPTVALPPQTAAAETIRQPVPEATAPGAAPRLQVLDAQGRPIQTVDLTLAGVTLGRDAGNTVRLDDAAISRTHLRVDWDGRQATVTDLGSSNGTMLGSVRLPPHAPQPWVWNDVVRAGPFQLRLQVSPTAPTQAADPLLAGLLGSAPAAAVEQPTQFGGGGRIGVRLDPPHLQLTPGQPATVHLVLTNQGRAADQQLLSVEGVPGEWVHGAEQAIPVGPGASVPITLTVTVPRSPESLAGDYAVVLRARSSSNPAESGTASARWTVRPFAVTSLSIAPKTAEGSSWASYEVSLRNDGNAAVLYRLSFEDDRQRLGYELARDQVAVAPGRAESVDLTVLARRRLVGSRQAYPFAVRAEADGEPPRSASAQFVQAPLLPIWAPILAVLLALAAIGALRLLSAGGAGVGALGTATAIATETPTPSPTPTPEPGAPVVQLFSVEPKEVAPGQPVTVAWNVQGAERVQIDQFGDVPPQGQREHRPEETTDYRLAASVGDKTTTRIERVTVREPTAVPTQAPSPSPTAAPSATPQPSATSQPSATPVPTQTPLPTATATPVGPAPIDLLAQAASARWRSEAGTVQFGAPANPPGSGAASLANAVALEDGQIYDQVLFTQPSAAAGGFIEGEYNLRAVGAGQFFIARVGFAQSAAGPAVRVIVSANDEIIYDQPKAPDGALDDIRLDLARFVGRSVKLILHVEGAGNNTAQDGVYWVQPRVDTP